MEQQPQHPGKDKPSLAVTGQYSLENAQKFGWGSISGELNAERREHLERHLVGPRVLDAGCGGGAYVHYLCEKGFRATGVDLYDEFLRVARERRLSGSFARASVTSLPFADKVFDSTFCFDVLEHIDDRQGIKELARVTRKRLIVAVPREDDVMLPFGLVFAHYRDTTHLRYYTEASLQALASLVNAVSVSVSPELPLPARELVHFFMESGFGPMQQAVRELLPEAPDLNLTVGFQPQEVRIEQPVAYHKGFKGAVKEKLANSEFVRAAYAYAYGEAYSRASLANYEGLTTGYSQAYQEAFARAFEEFLQKFAVDFYELLLERFLELSSFKTVYTGLVAVIDLE